MLSSFFQESILKRAQNKDIVQIYLHDLHDYSQNSYGSCDDYAYGGGAGMVIGIEPVALCIEDLKKERGYDEIIYTAPDGELLSQQRSNRLSMLNNVMILCGHYKGIDERIREHFITLEISIGDYVLTGGELAAAVMVDSVVRLIPGVLNDETSALSDSFQNNLISPPAYTRPMDFRGWKVPEILLSGDHEKIERWRYEQSVERTKLRRPNLLNDK